MIWAILRGYILSTKKINQDTNPFVYNTEQTLVLKALYSALKTKPFDFMAATKCLYKVFEEIYFPKTPGTSQSIFNSPVVVFLALEALHSSGEYKHIHLYPPIIAKIQFAIRLRASHRYVKWSRKYPNEVYVASSYLRAQHI